MRHEKSASLFIHISRDDDVRLNQAAARHDTCPSELVAVLVHYVLEHGLPPQVERELNAARDRRRAALTKRPVAGHNDAGFRLDARD